MSLFNFLQIAIVLIAIYFVFSLFASEIQEEIGSLFELRARTLKRSIVLFFGEQPDSHKFVDKLYKTSVFQSLNQYSKPKSWRKVQSGDAASTGPSYIGKELFVDAVIEVVNECLNDEESPLKTDEYTPIDDVITKLEGLETDGEYGNSFKRLLSIARAAKAKKSSAKARDFKDELAERFERSQERTSGVYRRNAKGLALAIGALLAFAVNIDTLNIIQVLERNPELANEIASLSEEFEACTGMPEGESTDCDPEELAAISERITADPRFDLGALIGWSTAVRSPLLPKDAITAVMLTVEVTKDGDSLKAERVTHQFNPPVDDSTDLSLSPSEEGTFSTGESMPLEILERQALFVADVAQLNIEITNLETNDNNNVSGQATLTMGLGRDSNVMVQVPLAGSLDNNAATLTGLISIRYSNSHSWFFRMLRKFLGWGISALAISMGAPFWFDLLNRFINVRNSGRAILSQPRSTQDNTEKKTQDNTAVG